MAGGNLRNILNAAAERLRELPTGRCDAQLLLLRALGRDAAWLLTHPEAVVDEEPLQRYEEWVARRARHEPMQYILGEVEFYGLPLKVTPDVLIPRPETEHVVEAVLHLSEQGRGRVPRETAVRICDVGTGSGAIATALAHALPLAEVTAVDIAQAALAVARENAERHGVAGRMRFVVSDLFCAVRGERFEVVVSNPPYVRDDEMLGTQVREFEPHAALFAGPTGLEAYQRLIPEAAEALMPGGWLVMEIGQGQRDAVAELLSPPQANAAGLAGGPGPQWDEVSFVQDLQGIPRVAIARRRASK